MSIWDHAEGPALVARVVSQAGGDTSSQQVVEGAAEALRIGAAQVCPEEFPASVLKSGPGFTSRGCQRPVVSARWWPVELRGGGQLFRAVVADRTARWVWVSPVA